MLATLHIELCYLGRASHSDCYTCMTIPCSARTYDSYVGKPTSRGGKEGKIICTVTDGEETAVLCCNTLISFK
jgi:hypothetical protein